MYNMFIYISLGDVRLAIQFHEHRKAGTLIKNALGKKSIFNTPKHTSMSPSISVIDEKDEEHKKEKENEQEQEKEKEDSVSENLTVRFASTVDEAPVESSRTGQETAETPVATPIEVVLETNTIPATTDEANISVL